MKKPPKPEILDQKIYAAAIIDSEWMHNQKCIQFSSDEWTLDYLILSIVVLYLKLFREEHHTLIHIYARILKNIIYIIFCQFKKYDISQSNQSQLFTIWLTIKFNKNYNFYSYLWVNILFSTLLPWVARSHLWLIW